MAKRYVLSCLLCGREVDVAGVCQCGGDLFRRIEKK
jgi:hypothetical protein